MPEWRQEILKRLTTLGIDPASEPAVVEELAQHLESRYEELLSSDADEETACAEALKELEHAEELTREAARRDPARFVRIAAVFYLTDNRALLRNTRH